MASSPSKPSAAARFLLDLLAAEELVARLYETAPEACRRHGGAQAVLAGLGGTSTRIGYWRLDFSAGPEGVALWEEIAAEHQAAHRGNAGDS